MELSSFQMKTIQHQFDSFCKKLFRNVARDYYDEIRRRLKREANFSELSRRELAQLIAQDGYSSDAHTFSVQGYDIAIASDLLAGALADLPEQMRDIVLLAYLMNMSDCEIGRSLNLVRSTVQYKRTSSLDRLKKHMEGRAYGKKES